MGEEAHFQAALDRPRRPHELFQGEHAHAAARFRARLGRICMNFHAAEQLDRSPRATALEWRSDLSAHRAVFAAHLSPQMFSPKERPLPERALRHEDFPRRLSLELGRAHRTP